MQCAKARIYRSEIKTKFLGSGVLKFEPLGKSKSEIPDGRSAQREAPVSESRNEQKAKALRMTGLSAKEFQESGFSESAAI